MVIVLECKVEGDWTDTEGMFQVIVLECKVEGDWTDTEGMFQRWS